MGFLAPHYQLVNALMCFLPLQSPRSSCAHDESVRFTTSIDDSNVCLCDEIEIRVRVCSRHSEVHASVVALNRQDHSQIDQHARGTLVYVTPTPTAKEL